MTSSVTSTTHPTTDPVRADRLEWLSGVQVACLGSSRALDTACRVLAQFGATVSAGPAADADVVLVDRIAGPTPVPGLGTASAADYLAHVERHNGAVWVTATAFGLGTDRGDAVGSDLTLLAAGGILGHSRIPGDHAPTLPAGSIALTLTGDVVALAALHGLHERRRTGRPVHADVSAQAAVLTTGLSLEMAHALQDCPDEGGSARYGAPTGFFDCLDGAVYVVVLEQHQWRGLEACLGDRLAGISSVEAGRAASDRVNAAMADWTATRSAQECEQALQEAGVPCTAVNDVATLLERSAAAGRPLDLAPGGPTMPALLTEGHADGAGDARPALSELRVLDAGHVLAVPLAAAWLGAMGARVTKLEDPERLDVYRRRGPFAGGIPGIDRSAYFTAINHSKSDLDLGFPEGASDLDPTAHDVILQNLSPRRARAVGVDAATALAAPGDRLVLSSSGFGGTGAWAGYRAYGHNIHAFAGLVAATRDARGVMADVGTPWCDPLTSVALVTWVTAWSLSTRPAAGVDLSMAEIMVSHLGELASVDAEREYTHTGDGIDLCLRLHDGGHLLAVSLPDTGERARLEHLLGVAVPAPARRGGLVDVRSESADSDAETEERLLAEGFAVSLVRTAPQLARDGFVRSTGLYATVESAALGPYEVVGLPWRFVGEPRPVLRAAPERGERR
jgi:crotonobetainyl-CoA:carnitine CoA-transferase CaiB-like acyl-CoA transferase